MNPPRPVPLAILAASFLFNLGQGALRPSLPLYLQRVFAANYRMVTLIPVVFGAGKWAATLPTGFLLDRLGRRRLMTAGLVIIACGDIAAAMTSVYRVFLAFRALAGAGWAMFATVATTTMVDRPGRHRRGRAISLLLMSETLGLLLGSSAGGWLYQGAGMASPFFFEAACLLIAAVTMARSEIPSVEDAPAASRDAPARPRLQTVLRAPGVLLMALTTATLMAVQTGLLVFLYPLYLVERGGLGPEAVGYLISLTIVGRFLALWLGGHAADRWGRMTVLVPGLLGYAAVLGGLPLVTDPAALSVWSLMIGVATGMVGGVPTVVVADRVAPSLQGIAVGVLRTMGDTGMLLGPLVMGTLADAVQLSAPFLFAAALLGVLAWGCSRQATRPAL